MQPIHIKRPRGRPRKIIIVPPRTVAEAKEQAEEILGLAAADAARIYIGCLDGSCKNRVALDAARDILISLSIIRRAPIELTTPGLTPAEIDKQIASILGVLPMATAGQGASKSAPDVVGLKAKDGEYNGPDNRGEE